MAQEKAVAVRAGEGWILKWFCPPDGLSAGAPALAVRSGTQWLVAPMGAVKDEVALALPSGGGAVLLPLGCPEEGGGETCEGDDPLCPVCVCAAHLASAYLVSLSGFPDVCTVGTFNGVWRLEWRQACVWQYDIDDTHSVRLSGQDGPFWRVTWSVAGAGGISGYYGGQEGDACAPQTQEYWFWQVSNTTGCTGLLSALMNEVVVTVALAGEE